MSDNRTRAVNIIFDGPPSHESGRFVEVETDDGKMVNAGEWLKRDDGLWALRIESLPEADPADIAGTYLVRVTTIDGGEFESSATEFTHMDRALMEDMAKNILGGEGGYFALDLTAEMQIVIRAERIEAITIQKINDQEKS